MLRALRMLPLVSCNRRGAVLHPAGRVAYRIPPNPIYLNPALEPCDEISLFQFGGRKGRVVQEAQMLRKYRAPSQSRTLSFFQTLHGGCITRLDRFGGS